MKHIAWLSLTLVFGFAQFYSSAQEDSSLPRWQIQPSVYGVDLSAGSFDATIAGVEISGDDVEFRNSVIAGLAVDFFVKENISIHTVLAYPPSTQSAVLNSLVGGSAGELTYAPLPIVGNYHFDLEKFQPFLGLGVNTIIVYDLEERDIIDSEINTEIGFMFRGGTSYFPSEKWGISTAVNKLYSDVELSGSVTNTPQGTVPGVVTGSLDPLIFSLGANYQIFRKD